MLNVQTRHQQFRIKKKKKNNTEMKLKPARRLLSLKEEKKVQRRTKTNIMRSMMKNLTEKKWRVYFYFWIKYIAVIALSIACVSKIPRSFFFIHNGFSIIFTLPFKPPRFHSVHNICISQQCFWVLVAVFHFGRKHCWKSEKSWKQQR